MKEALNTSTPDSDRWPQYEGKWRQRTKYTFFSVYANTTSLQVPWEEYFIACQFNGKACPELHQESSNTTILVGTGDNYSGVNASSSSGIYLGTSHWTLDPGRIYGYVNDSQDITQEHVKTTRTMPERIKWPKSPVVTIDSAKYQCFQIRMGVTSVKRAGSRAGLHLIFRRPYNRAETHPALLYADADASPYQVMS